MKASKEIRWMRLVVLFLVGGWTLGGAVCANVCTSPDAGGTALLMPDCPLDNQHDSMKVPVIGSTSDAALKFDGPLLLGGETARTPCGIMEVEAVEYFGAMLELDVSGSGELASYQRHLSLPVEVVIHTGPRNPGEPVQEIQTEIVSLQLVGGGLFGDPDFDLLAIRAGESHGLPSPGGTTVKQLPTGDFAVDSFFDITYQIEFAGTAPGPLEGLSGNSIGSIRVVTPQPTPATLMLGTFEEWRDALNSGEIQPMPEPDWIDFLAQFNGNLDPDSPPYPITTFITPELYVCEDEGGGGGGGGGGCLYTEPGLVMEWGDSQTLPPGEYASAWSYVYPADPDLTGTTITVTVEPPCGMNVVSLGLQDINGNIRGWYWNVNAVPPPPPPPALPAGTIPCSPAPGVGTTTVTINLSATGVTAATPTAASYASNPAFDIKKVASIKFDENNTWVGTVPAPSPGTGNAANWNYWYNLIVSPSTGGGGGGGTNPGDPVNSKWYVKWSQPPQVIDPDARPPLIRGWDEYSNYHIPPMVADDWQCDDPRPVTDIHWWGSFIGWTQPHPPPIMPNMFHIGIWTDVQAGVDAPFSHPGVLIWENFCDSFVWNFAGYDVDPRWGDPCENPQENESCFQFAQFLSEDEWFYQEDPCTIYWLSIAAIYNTTDPDPQHAWGWKTRQPHWNDDAVRFSQVQRVDGLTWPPAIGSTWINAPTNQPIEYPAGESWDVSFELTTSVPAYHDDPIIGDLNLDGTVSLPDLQIMSVVWLTSVAP